MLYKAYELCYSRFMKNEIVDFKHQTENFIFQLKETCGEGATNFKKHIHPCYEIMYFDGGDVGFTVEDRQYVMKKGDVLLIKPAQYHFGNRIFESPYRRYCMIFTKEMSNVPELVDKIFSKGEKLSLGENSLFSKLLAAFFEKLEKSAAHDVEFCKSMLTAILIALEDANPSAESKLPSKLTNYQKIINFINTHVNSIHSVDDISEALFFSKSYIMHLFKSELQIGVMQYVRNKKILLAHIEISKGRKPTDVYHECGFSNYPTFYRAYLSYFGFSPKNKSTLMKD